MWLLSVEAQLFTQNMSKKTLFSGDGVAMFEAQDLFLTVWHVAQWCKKHLHFTLGQKGQLFRIHS